MDKVNKAQLQEIFRELDFKKFMLELTDLESAEEVSLHYTLVNTPERYRKFLGELKQQQVFAVDVETTSVAPVEADIVGISFSWKEQTGHYLPLKGPEGEQCLSADEVIRDLKPILENDAIAKVGQNIKFDAIVLRGAGIELREKSFDTMVASYLLDPGKRRHNLDDLAIEFLSYKTIPIEDLIGKGKSRSVMAEVPLDAICRYSAEDADITWRLFRLMEPKLHEARIEKLFREVEMPLIDVLVDMESAGVTIDSGLLNRMSEELAAMLETLREKIYREAGEEFNIDSRNN